MTINYKDYMSISEAANITFDGYGNIERNQIYYLAVDGLIDAIQTDGNRWYINKEDFCNYVKSNDMKRKGVGMIRWRKGDTFIPIRGYDFLYAVNNRTGEIVNMQTGHVLKPYLNDQKHKRLCVSPIKNGVKQNVYVSRLIGAELPNALLKDIYHHIDGDPYNNRPSNILPVSFKEHMHLHRLMSDKSKKEDYRREVARIRRENKSKLHRIPHPELENDEYNCYWLWITTDGYSQYKEDGTIPDESIIVEQVAERSDKNHIPYLICER